LGLVILTYAEIARDGRGETSPSKKLPRTFAASGRMKEVKKVDSALIALAYLFAPDEPRQLSQRVTGRR